MRRPLFFFITCLLPACSFFYAGYAQTSFQELYRPQIHFSPKQHWINDPNGMVYYKGIYHLFYQYYPGGSNWGPMHWGHAESPDLVHWKERPIALYPDSLGYIFSGSAVVDSNNTSGFGKNGIRPLVAIFTNHDPKGEQMGRNDFQNQGIAFSLDNGETWTKYTGNPVLKNPGIRDFRDPKVMWYAPGKKWIMTLAARDRVAFYSSPNLKDWKRESDFGDKIGAHGGVWECPDLFVLNDHGQNRWVLIANINPGAPNKGSATQYFLGHFDGHSFTASDSITRWLDYGPDEYAGITWSNTGERKIFLGWMSNWRYAGDLPTSVWRNAMTLPRELTLKHLGAQIFLASNPVVELNRIASKPIYLRKLVVDTSMMLSDRIKNVKIPCRLDLQFDSLKDFSIVLSNHIGENLIIGFDRSLHQYYIDRSHSGKTDFEKDFGRLVLAPRFAEKPFSNLSIIIDESSIEIFADGGLSVMTALFFPSQPFDQIRLQSRKKLVVNQVKYERLQRIWN